MRQAFLLVGTVVVIAEGLRDLDASSGDGDAQ